MRTSKKRYHGLSLSVSVELLFSSADVILISPGLIIELIVPADEEFDYYRSGPISSEVSIQAEREALVVPDEANFHLESPGEPPEYTAVDPETISIPLPMELIEDEVVQRAIMNAQLSRTRPDGLATSDDIDAIFQIFQQGSNINPPPAASGNYYGYPSSTPTGLPPSLTPEALARLSNLDPALVKQVVDQNPQFQSQLASSVVPTASYPPLGEYGQRQPLPGPVSSAWDPHATAYNYAKTSTIVEVAPRRKTRGGVTKGRSSKDDAGPCRFYRTSRGCDWGDKCKFRHSD